MSYEDQIMDFLAKPENLPVAFEVAEYVEKLKEQVHYQFWEEFPQVFEDLLLSSQFSESWVFKPFNLERWAGRYESCGLIPTIKPPAKKSVLGVYMEQGTSHNDFRLLVGVRWVPGPENYESQPLSRLLHELRSMGKTQSNERWPGWNWINYRLRGQDFILRMKHEPEKLFGEVAKNYWDFFIHIHPFLMDVMEEYLEL